MGRPGDAGGGRPRDVLGTNICRLGIGLLGKRCMGSVKGIN